MPPATRRQRKAAVPPAPPAPAEPGRPVQAAPRRWIYLAASAAALVPCFWQSRIQAGDLSSHLYNAWLAQLIGQGKAPGLAIVPQSTNVLFDLLLSALFRAFGAAAAEKIAVSVAVLVFVWGAFAFCRAVAGRAWTLFPLMVTLAYGWVFHMGFFNFYLALGLCFWGLALSWSLQPRRLAAAAGLFALAYVAHGLPVAWSLAVLGYVWIARRWLRSPWLRLGIALAGIVALRIVLSATVQTRWTVHQIPFCCGPDQLWVYAVPVAVAFIALPALWLVQIALLVRNSGARQVFGGELFQICALTAAGIVILPDWINLPWYGHPLVFIAWRMSLPMAICVCALIATGPIRLWHAAAGVAVALLFFVPLYRSDSRLNDFEDAEEALVAGLPPGQRVVSAVAVPYDHLTSLAHIIDRVCIGRCYSFGNYEPATAQFRIRVVGPQSIVMPTDEGTYRVQGGTYPVQPRDLPLYQIEADHAGNLHLRSLPPGEQNHLTTWDGLR